MATWSPTPVDRTRDPTAADWWRGAILYQIYPRSFADSDGDGIGDLPGATARLDHVASLGVDGIWLSPFFASPMRDFGYDIADYRAVDPVFGTLADFDALIARAHALGLRVIIDQVYSHTSDDHAWFRESRASRDNARADWYVWADAKPDGSPPSNWQSVFGGPSWTWDARREQYYLHNFLAAQPDLNVRNPAVQDALIDTARFWLDRGVDGFRLDAINFAIHDPALTDNPPVAKPARRTRPFDFQHHLHNQSQPEIGDFLARLRGMLDARGCYFTVAEVGGEQADREMLDYTAGADRLHSAYGFTFLYADALDPTLVASAQAGWPSDPGVGWPSWAFSNHDAPRVASRWAGDHDTQVVARFAMTLLMCLRGNAFIYQGEELGLPQGCVPFERLQDPEAIANWPQTHGRDGARTPMPWQAVAHQAGFSTAEPWLPLDPAHRALSVDRQQDDAGSMLAHTRAMVALRHDRPALRTGGVAPLDYPSPLLGFQRGTDLDAVLCVFNTGRHAVDWPLPDGWRVLTVVNGATARMLPPFGALLAIRS
ncbi:alpha-amylase family glycosyl hydrolase [uncultured Sphingomonas sp.]|uniref:alpha-amylase family glycosyl hydrolase n=1 Tax=uncultured Sphingomonas sp. TaxID=158754 RepID=UPI0035CB0C6F